MNLDLASLLVKVFLFSPLNEGICVQLGERHIISGPTLLQAAPKPESCLNPESNFVAEAHL